jgi:hypothetical protein
VAATAALPGTNADDEAASFAIGLVAGTAMLAVDGSDDAVAFSASAAAGAGEDGGRAWDVVAGPGAVAG